MIKCISYLLRRYIFYSSILTFNKIATHFDLKKSYEKTQNNYIINCKFCRQYYNIFKNCTKISKHLTKYPHRHQSLLF